MKPIWGLVLVSSLQRIFSEAVAFRLRYEASLWWAVECTVVAGADQDVADSRRQA